MTPLALGLGYGLDLLFGDPAWLPHPVVGFGKMISAGERRLNHGSARARFAKCALLALGLVALVGAGVWALLAAARQVHPTLATGLEVAGVFYGLANRTLIAEGRAVFRQLEVGLAEGRRQLARSLICEQHDCGGTLTPWGDIEGFARECERRMRAVLAAGAEADLCFFDRGLPDISAYLRHRGREPWVSLGAGLEAYVPVVLIAPPWEEIFVQDRERVQTFEESVEIHRHLVATYRAAGFAIKDLPCGSVAGRVQWITEEKPWLTSPF
jgi:predicted ATPase